MTIDAAATEALRAYDWPGNVRELRNIAERLSVFGTDPITIEQLPSDVLTRRRATAGSAILHITETGAVVPLREFKSQCEKEYIEAVLRKTNWNVSRAAQLLDVQRTHLHQKIAALGIVRPASAKDEE